MPLIIALLALGSLILAWTVSWQVKYINSDWLSIAQYNFRIIPFLFIANFSLGMAFIKGHRVVKNLPLLIASQSFIYYIFILLFTLYLLGDKVSTIRVVAAFSLMAFSVWLLKS